MVTLIVPPGTLGYPVSHGTASFEPYPDGEGRWLVDVPDEVAAHLLHVGGFAVAKKAESMTLPAGMVTLRHPEGVACSFAGRVYAPDAEGVVRVPAAAAAELTAHGFVAVGGAK
ncbi:MAG TPA: hypothetical protein VJ770_04550 [Stellaceae bacterium]|nr:hypothetical protein [Stellaceae bacterium]